MGTEDIRRQAPNVERMKLLGAEVVPVEAGARTLKEAVSAAIRDWVANVETTHYVIGSAVGPAPFPALVRDLQRVIGDEAREQALAAEGRPAGAGDRLRRRRLQRDRHLHPLPRRRGGRADRRRGRRRGARERPPRRLARRRHDRRPARLALLGDRRRGGPDPRGALGLRRARLPGRRAPSTPSCATAAAPATTRSPTRQALAAFAELARLEGIIPALESSHAIAWLLENGGGGGLRRPLPLRARRQGPGRGDVRLEASGGELDERQRGGSRAPPAPTRRRLASGSPRFAAPRRTKGGRR